MMTYETYVTYEILMLPDTVTDWYWLMKPTGLISMTEWLKVN